MISNKSILLNLVRYIIALIIIWSGFCLFYPERRFLMVLFVTCGLFFSSLILDKISALSGKNYAAKKDMLLSTICILCAVILSTLIVPYFFTEAFSSLSLLIGCTLGLLASLPVLWSIVKKANKAEFYLISWTIDWPAIQIFIIGILFLLSALFGFILMVISIEMMLESVISVLVIVLFVIISFFASSFVEIKIIELLYNKEFYLGWLGKRKMSLSLENSQKVVGEQK